MFDLKVVINQNMSNLFQYFKGIYLTLKHLTAFSGHPVLLGGKSEYNLQEINCFSFLVLIPVFAVFFFFPHSC